MDAYKIRCLPPDFVSGSHQARAFTARAFPSPPDRFRDIQVVAAAPGFGVAQEEGHSDFVFNADGTGSLRRGEIVEKITFADKGDGTYEMSTERVQKPIKQGYRIEGDMLYTIDPDLGIEEAYKRQQ